MVNTAVSKTADEGSTPSVPVAAAESLVYQRTLVRKLRCPHRYQRLEVAVTATLTGSVGRVIGYGRENTYWTTAVMKRVQVDSSSQQVNALAKAIWFCRI